MVEHDDAFWHNERAWADYLGAKSWNRKRRPLRPAADFPDGGGSERSNGAKRAVAPQK